MDGLRRLDAPAPVVRVPRFNAVVVVVVVVDSEVSASSGSSVNTSPPPLKDSSDLCILCILLSRLLVPTAVDDIIVSRCRAASAVDRNVRPSFFAVIIDTDQPITKARLTTLKYLAIILSVTAPPWHLSVRILLSAAALLALLLQTFSPWWRSRAALGWYLSEGDGGR